MASDSGFDPVAYASDFASIEEAMEAITTDVMTSPWPWNQWQRTMSALLPHYLDASRDTRYWSTLRKRMMAERFGTDWAKKAVNPQRDAALETIQEEDRVAGARGAGSSASGAEQAIGPGDGCPALEDSSTPGEGAGNLPEGGAGGAGSGDPGASSPDGRLRAALANGRVAQELLGANVASVVDAFPARDSETSSQCDARVANICDSMEGLGVSESAIVQGAKIEFYLRQLTKRFVHDPEAGSGPLALRVWAAKLFDEQGYLEVSDQVEAEAFLLALSRMGEIKPEVSLRAVSSLGVYFQSLAPGTGPRTEVHSIATPREVGPSSSERPRGSPAGLGENGTEFTPTEGRQSAGGGSTSMVKDLVGAFKEVQQEMAASQKQIVEYISQQGPAGPAEGSRSGLATSEARVNDKLNAITGLEFKQSLPVIKDSNPDFEKHWRHFQSLLDCHSFGRQGVRPLDVIVLLRKTLPDNSSRKRTYDTLVDRARKKGRLPDEAKEVLTELRARLTMVIRETPFQKEDRLDKEFEKLDMNRMTHVEFRSLFEEKLEELEDAGMGIASDASTLQRKYLSKLEAGLRRAVMSQLWPLDGEELASRRPKTWEEVARCVDMELEHRVDANAPTDQISALGGSYVPPGADGSNTKGMSKCGHCQRTGHLKEQCPLKAAQVRGDVAKSLAESARTGKCCTVCGQQDHREEHHRFGAADAFYAVEQGRLKWQGSPGGIANKPGPGQAGTIPGDQPCKMCGKKGSAHGFTENKNRAGHPIPKWCTMKGEGGGNGAGGAGSGAPGAGAPVPPPPIVNYPREAPPNLTRSKLFDWARGERRCFQCWKPLADTGAHPEGKPCARPDAPPGEAGSANSKGRGKGGKGGKGGRGAPRRSGEAGFTLFECMGAASETTSVFDVVNALAAPTGSKPFVGPAGWLEARTMEAVPPAKKEECAKAVAEASSDLEALFQLAEESEAIEVRSMSGLPGDWYQTFRHARPPGYAAQTRLFFGGLAVPALLDYGATVSAISEELACVIIQNSLDKANAGEIDPDSDLYPLSRLEYYKEPWDLGCVAKDPTKPLRVEHGIVLRAEFVPVNGVSGVVDATANHPTRPIYFKVLPMGSCGMEGILLGYPTLDSAPYGFDHHREETTHVFRALNVSLPRGELSRRSESRGACATYFASKNGETVSNLKENVKYLSDEACCQLHEAAVALAKLPCAVYDSEDVLVAPGEQAMVPCRWDKAIPEHDFACASVESLGTKIEVIPGLCAGGVSDVMLCVENSGELDVSLTRGDVLAAAGEVPEGMLFYRKGTPEVLQGAPGGGLIALESSAAGAGSSARGTEMRGSAPLSGPCEGLWSLSEQLPTPAYSTEVDSLNHLVQDDDLIMRIHAEELPPDEYYDALAPVLAEKFKGATPKLLEHIVALVAAFDTATSFALSFGIAKFQLCQQKVKLVGEYVGKEGRSPNPDLVSAIKAWPSINNLKELQSFLGTANYVRPHMGPAYARIAHPLRPLMSPKGVFPMNKEQLDAIEGLKGLILEAHLLAVPDEGAAVEAAMAFVAGEPPRGRPYELGADTSKIATGGVMGQCQEKNGALLVLMYWSAPLSVGQSQWHPFEQEFWGLWMFRRETVKHFGRVPCVIHTDHGTLTRLEYLPLPRIEPKHFRWHAELTSGGSRFLYRAGTGAAHRVPDALSRHPPVRDDLILARTGDWEQHRSVIRGIEREILDGTFGEDDRAEPLTWEAALAQTGHKVGDAQKAADAAAEAKADVGTEAFKGKTSAEGAGSSALGAGGHLEGVRRLVEESRTCEPLGVAPKESISALLCGSEWLCAADVKPIEALFLGPFAVTYEVNRQLAAWKAALLKWLSPADPGESLRLRMMVCACPFDVETSIDGKGFWANPVHRLYDERKKILRKHLFTSIVHALSDLVRHQSRVILGYGQGAVVVALMSQPLVVEAACRARIVADVELGDIRRAWAGVEWLIAVDPIVLPQRTLFSELHDALPELMLLQPRGIVRTVVVTPKYVDLHQRFGKDLAAAIGTPCLVDGDPLLIRAADVVSTKLHQEPPIYIEDDVAGHGCCAVCGKRSALGRCVSCGLLMHFRCVPPLTPGGPLECPRCAKQGSKEPAEAPMQSDAWSYGQLKAAKFEKGALAPAPVGLSRGMDPRPACNLLERPSDEDAVKAGFKDGQEWYAYSAGGALVSAAALDWNRDSLPEPASAEASVDPEMVQQWRLLKGDVAPPRAGGELLDSGRSGGDLPVIEPAGALGAGSGAWGAEGQDMTAALADRMSFPHPYLLVDVESGHRSEDAVFDLREDLSSACAAVWQKDTTPGAVVVDLPVVEGVPDLRAALRVSQAKDPASVLLVKQLEHALDPETARKRKTGMQKQGGPLRPASAPEEGTWRLAPVDGVLERYVVFSVAALWLPYLPASASPAEVEGTPVTWRRWAFLHAHESFLNPHRTSAETFQVLRRMGYWETLASDCGGWCLNCAVCRRFRGHAVLPPLRSMLADDQLAAALPWSDVIIDVQGPFTRAETGEQYVLSYHSVQLRVPLLEPFKSLQSGHFSRALVACIMRSRNIPDVVRSDRGPEMRSAVNAEFLAIMNIKHVMGAALTPRHQGLGERGHQVMLSQHTVLMHAVCHAFPQEWPALVPAVEYLYFTAPQGAHGLSAHDMSCGYAIAVPDDARLTPFMAPDGVASTDIAVRLFANFRELYGLFQRVKTEESMRSQMRLNATRHERVFEKGETVFRRLPAGARLPKHLFPEPSSGPYEVVSQPTSTSVILKNPADGKLVDDGARVPLDQVLAGPARPNVAFPEETEVRGIGQMLREEHRDAGQPPVRSGAAAGKRKGWGPLAPGAHVAYQTRNGGDGSKDLTVGKVLINHREDRRVTLQPHRGCWRAVRVVHLPQFQTREGYADSGADIAKETVRYEALVAQVELLQGGELTFSSSRVLEKRGWGLLVTEAVAGPAADEAAAVVENGARGAGSGASGADSAPTASLSRRALRRGPAAAIVIPQVGTSLGGELERVSVMSAGKRIAMDRAALCALAQGHRVAFFELFCGEMRLTLGVRAYGLAAPDGVDSMYQHGPKKWDLTLREDQQRVECLLEALDPVILHASPPSSALSASARRHGEKGYFEGDWQRAVTLAVFCLNRLAVRESAGGAGSYECPKGSKAWRLPPILAFFGDRDHPKAGRYFADPDLCQFGMTEPRNAEEFWRKSIVIAATYPEVGELAVHCPKQDGKPKHYHVRIRGAVRPEPSGPAVQRTKLSNTFPMPLALAWGRVIAKACFRICSQTAEEWAAKELAAAKADPHRALAVALEVKRESLEQSFAIWVPQAGVAKSMGGRQEQLFELADLFADDGCDGALVKGLSGAAGAGSSAPGAAPAKAEVSGQNPSPGKPVKADRQAAEAAGRASWGSLSPGAMTPAQLKWMAKLKAGDLGGVDVDPGQYLELRNSKVAGNPRAESSYKDRCAEAVGLGPVPDERYVHITNPADFELMRWAVKRGSGCMWLPDSPRTCVRGFLHQLVTRGPPVRQGIHRLSKPDTEWIEQAIREDVARGQLVKGVSDWGFPAFPTKESPDHKAIKRKRRMVVDYRALNRVTVRKVFLIPNSDYIKSCVSGSEYISVGDLKEGFNQVDNTPETAAKMAVLSASGCYLPRGLTFGPTNGPEDFQDLVFNVFSRRLYREWYLFLDDLSIATGRKNARHAGPSNAEDVWG